VSKFEDDLHKAALNLPYEAEVPESIWRRFRDRNDPARIEGKRRLREIAADVSNFLTKQGVPPQQVVVSLYAGSRLVEVCQAWSFTGFFLVTTGRFCTIRSGNPGYIHGVTSEIEHGQLYLGQHVSVPPVEEYLPGVEGAVFVPEGKLPQAHFDEHEFLTFYYGDLYRPSLGWGAPYQALLLTSAAPELWLATRSHFDDRGISVGRLDGMFANQALQLVEAHRNGRPG
jgi:hypothetical protein